MILNFLKKGLFGALLFFSTSSFANDFYQAQVQPLWAKTFDSRALALWISGAASVALVNPSDEQIRSEWRDHQKMSAQNEDLGDFLGSGIAGALVAAAQINVDQDNGYDHARALIYTGLSTYALKTVFSRQRPGNSENRQSFPSGHTSTAFATATSLSYAYGWKAAMVAYPLAVFVGASRLSDDVHYGSDVVGGAFLGIICARAARFSASRVGAEISFVPWIDEGLRGLQVDYRF